MRRLARTSRVRSFGCSDGETHISPLSGFPDAFTRNFFDVTLGLAWTAMTDGQRLTSSTNDTFPTNSLLLAIEIKISLFRTSFFSFCIYERGI